MLVTIERISCLLYGYITIQLKKLRPIGKGRREGGTSRRKKEFWDRARCGRFALENVMRHVVPEYR